VTELIAAPAHYPSIVGDAIREALICAYVRECAQFDQPPLVIEIVKAGSWEPGSPSHLPRQMRLRTRVYPRFGNKRDKDDNWDEKALDTLYQCWVSDPAIFRALRVSGCSVPRVLCRFSTAERNAVRASSNLF
jgi:hypothetical protein